MEGPPRPGSILGAISDQFSVDETGSFDYLLEEVRELLDAGASADDTCGPRRNSLCDVSALLKACTYGYADIVRLLLERGARPDFGGVADTGVTCSPLFTSIESQKSPHNEECRPRYAYCVSLLLQYGAALHVPPDITGFTSALELAQDMVESPGSRPPEVAARVLEMVAAETRRRRHRHLMALFKWAVRVRPWALVWLEHYAQAKGAPGGPDFEVGKKDFASLEVLGEKRAREEPPED